MDRRYVFSLLCVVATYIAANASGDDRTDYRPAVSGCVRTGYEWSTADGSGRFAVYNARLRLDGSVMPRVSYRIQADMCDKGRIRLKDAFVRLSPDESLSIFAGQERVPFSVDASRDVGDYYFSDLSFGADYLGNLRSVGVKAGYELPWSGLYIEGGVFAPSADEQSRWERSLTYGVKINCDTRAGLTPQVCFMSRKPYGGVRYNLYDISLSWRYGNWFLEGEYLHCDYACASYPDAHTFNLMADYGLPLSTGFLSRLSFRGRFDGMSGISDGIAGEGGVLVTDHRPRKRLTLGVRTSSVHGSAGLDFMVSYQQYFYRSGADAGPDDNNRLVAMMILRF